MKEWKNQTTMYSLSIKDAPHRRAMALASANYFTECSLSGVSSTSACLAQDAVLHKQSRWWRHGDDPKHPANSLTSNLDISEGGDEPGSLIKGENDDDEGEEEVGPRRDENQVNGDWDVPIYARDDDYPSSQPFLKNIQFKRKSTLSSISQESHNASKSCVEDVIRSLAAYPNHYFAVSDKPPFSVSGSNAQPVTSESETDGSFYSSETSLACAKHTKLPRKRCRISLDEDATLKKTLLQAKTDRAKEDLLSTLGDTSSKTFLESLEILATLQRHGTLEEIDGTWVMVSQPEYPSCLGTNMKGDKLYTLERMSFGMYQPCNLVCSIQHQFNTISTVKNKADMPYYVPSILKDRVVDKSGKNSRSVKTYNIIASFTIETQEFDGAAVRGIMTNYAYTLPDPSEPQRLSIWFTGGTIEPANEDEESMRKWKEVFRSFHPDKVGVPRDSNEARHLAQYMFLGAVSEPMDEKGLIGYHLERPIGGHGSAFCDIVYMDCDLRVMSGHSGSIYVFKRTE